MPNTSLTQNNSETPKLRLFTVTLPWSPNNSDNGDYSTKTWAANHSEAIRNVAEEMADHEDSGIKEDDEAGRAAFIQDIVRGADVYAAAMTGDTIPSDLHDIMTGPSGKMNAQARKDYEQIMAILAQYQ